MTLENGQMKIGLATGLERSKRLKQNSLFLEAQPTTPPLPLGLRYPYP